MKSAGRTIAVFVGIVAAITLLVAGPAGAGGDGGFGGFLDEVWQFILMVLSFLKTWLCGLMESLNVSCPF